MGNRKMIKDKTDLTLDKADLLDPLAVDNLSDYEREVVADAQNAGKNLESTVPKEGGDNLLEGHDTGGIIEQTVNSKAVEGFGQPGGESDISGGIANLDETAGKKVEQNRYND